MGERSPAPLTTDRVNLGWTALASVGFVIVACVVTGGVALYVRNALHREPLAAAHSYLLDLRARPPRHGQALRRMVPSYQRAHGAATFQNAIEHARALTDHTADDLSDVELYGDRATVEGELVTPSGRTPVRFELLKVDGYWYIERVLLDGQPVG